MQLFLGFRNVIDVASLGSYSLEQHEYRERMSFYFNKLKSPMSSKSLSKAQKQELLQDVPNPEKVLQSSCTVSADDLTYVSSLRRMTPSRKNKFLVDFSRIHCMTYFF